MCIGEPDQAAATSSSRWPLCPGPRTSSTRPPSSWPTRRSWVWRRRWRRTSWRMTSSTSSHTYSLARPSPWRNLSSCRKSNLFHFFQGRDGDLPLLVHRRPLHDHSYHPLQPLLFSHMAWSPAACLQWDRWTGKKTVRTFFRKRFVRWLMRSWSQLKLLPGLLCHVQYNDKEFQGCRSSRLLWKRRSGCGQMGLRCRATVSRCGIEESVAFDVFLWKGNMMICWLLHLSGLASDKISSIIPNTQDLVLSGYEVPAGTHLDLNPSVHFR